MSKRDFLVTSSETHITITVKRKTAERMAVLLSDCGDWIGNIEPEDVDMTAKQLSAAEDDITYLSTSLSGDQP